MISLNSEIKLKIYLRNKVGLCGKLAMKFICPFDMDNMSMKYGKCHGIFSKKLYLEKLSMQYGDMDMYNEQNKLLNII